MTADTDRKNAEERLAELRYRIRKLLPNIQSAEAKWLLDRCLQEKKLAPESYPETLRWLWRSRYLRRPVSVREFVDDNRYLGRRLAGSVYPKLVEGLELLFAGEYSEVVLGGAIGWGKTTFGTIAVAYDLYRLSCLRDPALAYGMKSGSNLTFVNISVDKRQAEKVFFTDLYNLIKESPYFNHIFPYDKRLKNEIRFRNNVRCYPVAASEQAALGTGVCCAFIDEANFMEVVERSRRTTAGEGGVYDQVAVVFNKLKQRMRSRMNLRGHLPGHIYVASSARYPGDMTERMEKLAREEAEKGEQHILVLHHALWDTHPPSSYMGERFKVEVGDLMRRSRVLDGSEIDVNPERVIEVPLDFKREFDRDPDGCVRDYAGIPTLSIKPFLVRREMIRKMFAQGEAAGLRHPFTQLDATLQHKDPDYERLLPQNLHWVERAKKNALGKPMFRDGQPVLELALYPALYHAHFDLSKSGDATGLCVGHVVGTKRCRRFDEDTMRDTEEVKPVIRIDWVQRIVPPPHGEIDIPRVRALIYQLSAVGMEFGSITCDQFGSQESVKTLKEKGYPADIFSLDTDKDGYSALKDAIYDGRVLCYHVPVLERELAQLEDVGKKIDHPSSPGSSKDLADCLAAVVHHCEESWRKGEGARGLFQLGIVEYPGEMPQVVQDRMMDVQRKLVAEQSMTSEDEDKLLFDPFLHDLLTMDDKERFGGQ